MHPGSGATCLGQPLCAADPRTVHGHRFPGRRGVSRPCTADPLSEEGGQNRFFLPRPETLGFRRISGQRTLIPRSPRTSPGGASPAAQEPAPSRSWPTGSPRRVVDGRCDERFLTHSARTAGPGGPTLPFPAAIPAYRETFRRAVPVDVPQVPVLWTGPFGRRLPAAERICRSEDLPVGVNRPGGGTRGTRAKGDRSHHQRSVSAFTGGRNRSCVRKG